MKHLYLLRAVPGAGKTTLINKYGLGTMTLSPDAIRKMYSNTDYRIMYDENGEATVTENINSIHEGKVWETLKQMMEERMKRGETTIIDATHTNLPLIQDYNKLVDKYRYRIFTIQLDIPLEQALEQNRQRPEHLRLSDRDVIRKQEQLDQSTPIIPKKYSLKRFNTIDEAGQFILQNSTWRTKVIDPKQYEKVFVIGDIHATYGTLEKFLNENYSPNNYYVFTGDYLDRGLMPVETVNALYELNKLDNVVMLRGNHDLNYENWFNIPEEYTEDALKSGRLTKQKIEARKEEIRNFTRMTNSSMRYIKELQGMVTPTEFEEFKMKLKSILDNIQDVFMFSVNGQKYLCTHGGAVANVLNFRGTGSMINFATTDMVKGSGSYEDDIDVIYTKQMLELPEEERVIQIHGHRNNYEHGVLANKYSYNVEQHITDGGYMGVIEINAITGETKDISIKNNNHRITLQNTDINEYPVSKFFKEAGEDEYIKVKKLTTVEDVYSVNFSEKAFYDKVWTGMTVRARGLFINPVTEEVVARSYDKFFNMGEQRTTRKHVLGKKLKFPVTVTSKMNGFLGIMTVYRGEFLFLSKSTDNSTFSNLFKDTFMTHTKELGINLDELKSFISKNNVSIVFEVIDQEKDPHIIKYEKKQGVVLLDVFKNQLGEETLNKHEIPELHGFPMPEERIFTEWEELRDFLNVYNKGVNLRSNPVISGLGEEIDTYNEGFVIKDENNFRVKVKSDFYSKWKGVRPIIHQRLKGKRGESRSKLGSEFLHFLINERQDGLTLNILTEREEFVKYMKTFEPDTVLSK